MIIPHLDCRDTQHISTAYFESCVIGEDLLLRTVQEAQQRMAELVPDKRVKGVRGLLESLSKLAGLTEPHLLRGKRQNPN